MACSSAAQRRRSSPTSPCAATASSSSDRWHLQDQLDLLDRAAAHGARIFGQSRSEPFSHVIAFKTRLPFDRLPEWQEVRRHSIRPARRHLAGEAPPVRR
jgi:hypothetical protein